MTERISNVLTKALQLVLAMIFTLPSLKALLYNAQAKNWM